MMGMRFSLHLVPDDLDLMTAARDDAATIIARDPRLMETEHCGLRRELRRRYAAAAQFVAVA